MDINKIVQLRLFKHDFKKILHNSDYSIKYVDYTSYETYLDKLLYISKLMHKDFEWDGIPTESNLHNRFKNNSKCFIYYYNNEPVGWTWFHSHVSIDWISTYQNLNSNELYVGGAYVSKTCNLPAISGFMFYNISFWEWLTKFNYNIIYLYSDSWNRASAQLCYKSGFTKYNFLNETD